MNKKRQLLQLISLTLIVSMAAVLFTGCAQTGEQPVGTESQPSSAVSGETNIPAVSAPPAESAAPAQPDSGNDLPETSEAVTAPTLPLCDETQALSIWYAWPPPLAAIMDSPDGNPYYSELENRTNVHIDWQIVSTETVGELFNLMVISGSAPDMIQGGSGMYTGGADKAVEDEFLLDCMPHLDTLMPNLKAILQDSVISEAVLTPARHLVDFPTINDEPEGAGGGLVCRADWLEQLNLDIPKTYDDYYEVLTAFKTELNASAPLLIPYTGFMNSNMLFSGYGIPGAIGSGAFLVDGDTVLFGPAQTGFAECVKTLSHWYAEGLIDSDFMTRTSSRDPATELIYGNQSGIWDCSTSNIPVYASTGGFELTPIYTARQDEAGTDYLIPEKTVISTGLSISTNCKDQELAMRWIDYLYSEEGSFLSNYGIEDLTFVYDENGDPQLTELILKNPDGLPFSLAQCIYICQQTPYFCHWKKLWRYYSDTEILAYEMWNDTDLSSTKHVFPASASMNSSEAEEFTLIMGDVETYLSETYFSILVGEASTDKLAEIPSMLESMNIVRAVEIKQAAYNRYKGIE